MDLSGNINDQTELTKEQVAEALGWSWADSPMVAGGCWFDNEGRFKDFICPDFVGDLNVSRKYVMPELYRLHLQLRCLEERADSDFKQDLLHAYQYGDMAMYLAKRLMAVKEIVKTILNQEPN